MALEMGFYSLEECHCGSFAVSVPCRFGRDVGRGFVSEDEIQVEGQLDNTEWLNPWSGPWFDGRMRIPGGSGSLQVRRALEDVEAGLLVAGGDGCACARSAWAFESLNDSEIQIGMDPNGVGRKRERFEGRLGWDRRRGCLDGWRGHGGAEEGTPGSRRGSSG